METTVLYDGRCRFHVGDFLYGLAFSGSVRVGKGPLKLVDVVPNGRSCIHKPTTLYIAQKWKIVMNFFKATPAPPHPQMAFSEDDRPSVSCQAQNNFILDLRNVEHRSHYVGTDKSLARPGRKQPTVTEDLEFHIHSFSILSDDRSKASSITIPPHSAI